MHDASSGEPNVYAYVSGRALQAVDPLGLEDACANGACVKAPVQALWENGVELARSLQLPVRAVQKVGQLATRSSEGGYAAYNAASDQLLISDDFADDLGEGHRMGEYGRDRNAFILNTMFHETAHRESTQMGLVDMGVRLQKENAWLGYKVEELPTTAEEIRRAVSEEIAGYVGHRVQVFATAMQQLRDGVVPVSEVAEQYNRGMQELGHGYYVMSSGQMTFSQSGILPQGLKELVDDRILDGEVADTFQDTNAFSQYKQDTLSPSASDERASTE